MAPIGRIDCTVDSRVLVPVVLLQDLKQLERVESVFSVLHELVGDFVAALGLNGVSVVDDI